MKRLGEIVRYRKGKPPKMSAAGTVPVLTPGYLRSGAIEELAEPTAHDVVLSGKEIILLWDGSNAGEFFRARSGILSSTMVVFDFDEQTTNRDHLFYELKRFEPELKGQTSGSGIPHVDKEILLGRKLIERDPKQQQKVVEVISNVDRAIEQTEVLLAKQQRIKAGLTHDLLTRGLDAKGELRDPATHDFKKSPLGKIPTEWDVVSLDSLVANNAPICYGIVQVGPDTPGGVPTIAIRDLGNITVSQVHHTERARESKFVRSRVVSGDLLLSIKATTGELGIVPPGFSGNISRDLARIRLQASDNPAYFKYQLQSDAGQRRLSGIIVGTTRREISIIPLRNLLVARPKKDEQDAIAERIQGTEIDMAALKTEFDKLLRLKAGLMQDLLTGRVPVTPLLAAKKN